MKIRRILATAVAAAVTTPVILLSVTPALADAKEEAEQDEPECVFESKLSTVVTGLPSKIVSGSTTDFSLRVTNGTDKTLNEVSPYVYF
ncbi:peptidase, partial [Streptomyces sp. NPDC058418]